MNRLIEFRAKRIDNGEWVYGAYVPDYTLEDPTEVAWIADNEYGIHYEVDPKTLGQAFEIKGTKYFEGDCLSWRSNTLRVVFKDGLLLAVSENGDVQPMALWPRLDECAVSGTIHDQAKEKDPS